MHERSPSLSTISGTESEAGDDPVAGSLAYDSDEDDEDLNTGLSEDTSTSFEYEQLSAHDQGALRRVVDSLSKLEPRFFPPSDIPCQPPHPQHLPSPLEFAQTKALIEDRELEVSELNAKLDELARDMLSLIQQRDAAAEAARNHRSFIAGIRRVPMDVLAEIFQFYLASGRSCSPWTLTAVSRAFRATAFSTPRLWGHITITNKDPLYRWMNGSEQCNTLRRLQRALSRAAATPLDIDINLRTEANPDSKLAERATKLLRTLLRTSSRWISLNIGDFWVWDFDYGRLEKDYRSLESLVITGTTPPGLIIAIHQSALNLTSLESKGLQITNFAVFSITWWSRLTTLSYKAHSRDDIATYRIRILDTIAQCTQLRKLTLSMGTLRFTAAEVAPFNSRSLPNLRKLYFINVNCVMLFKCPKLTHLSYETNHLMPARNITTVIHNTDEHRLKRLVYLKVESTFVGQYLAPLVAPNLRDLRITVSGTRRAEGLDGAFRKLWEERSEVLSPKFFQLKGMSLGVNVLKSALEKMEGLESLTMTDVKIAKTAFKNFAIKLKDKKRIILCPKLVTLDVDCSKLEAEEVEYILREVAESRRIAGIPLESLIYRNLQGTLDLCQS